MTNKRIMRFSVLFVLIFLLVGLNAVSAAEDNSVSNLTDNLELTAVSDSQDIISDLSSSEDTSQEVISADDSEEEIIDATDDAIEPKSDSGTNKVHTVTPENYSKYFDSKGNLNKSLVKANETLNLSGNFSNKNFIINIPITITSTENDAFLKNSPIYIVNVSNKNFKYDAIISNLNIESNLANISAIWIIG